MSENTIPPEMLTAAATGIVKLSRDFWTMPGGIITDGFVIADKSQQAAQAALEAAGVPTLLAEHDAAMAMLAANDIYDTSLTDRISVLLERYKSARQDAAKGWRAAEQYRNDSETLRLLDEQRQANDRLRALKTLITTRIAELEQELEIARTGGSE